MLCSLASVSPDICFFNSQVWFSRQIKMAPFHPMSCIKLDRTPASLKRPTKSDGHIGGPAQTLVASSTSSTALFGFRVSDLKTHGIRFFFFPAVYQWQRGPPWSQYVVSNTLYYLVQIKKKKKKSLLMWSAYRGALESVNASVSRRQRHFPAAGHLLFMTAGAEEPLRWRREMICGGAAHSLWWNHPINSGSRHWIRSPNCYVCIVSVQIAAVFNHAYYVSVPWNWFRCATQTRCTVYYI